MTTQFSTSTHRSLYPVGGINPEWATARFERTVQILRGLPTSGPIQTTFDDKLNLYAAYKQSQLGDLSTPRPGLLDFLGRAKWDAWNKLRGCTIEEAQRIYVETFMQVLRRYSDADIAVQILHELENFAIDVNRIHDRMSFSRFSGIHSNFSGYTNRIPVPQASYAPQEPENDSFSDDTDKAADDEPAPYTAEAPPHSSPVPREPHTRLSPPEATAPNVILQRFVNDLGDSIQSEYVPPALAPAPEPADDDPGHKKISAVSQLSKYLLYLRNILGSLSLLALALRLILGKRRFSQLIHSFSRSSRSQIRNL